uniref:DNA-directed RNA polymerase subunit beta n=1 Tax=Pseudo-nitzschia sp. TaxID=1804765 RepID=A0A8T9D5T0_9STRA|nr:RNA polymerase subunit beta [Pseudo-nitzschia simulans]UBA15885.1 RNA polymerase subunit beta [Pseudo-nitzschia sp.]
MHKNINYINALPDFLAMQRVSFCWFITQGLTEELALFSKIQDFSQNTEYLIFSQEYVLIKPLYNLVTAKKYSGNYRAQLVIPIEVRNKVLNQVHYQNQFPIITLPLMTTYATFIINGCERVIVSQIIRSPGIYFEKNKNQRIQNHFKRKLSADIHKLRTFLPSGEAFISEFDLFLATPKMDRPGVNYADTDEKIIHFLKRRGIKKFVTTSEIPIDDPKLQSRSSLPISYYSLAFLKQTRNEASFSFFQCFKFYVLVSQALKANPNSNIRVVFLKWLKQKYTATNAKINFTDETIDVLLKYFQFLLKVLTKYKIVAQRSKQSSESPTVGTTSSTLDLSEAQIRTILQLYTETITNSQLTVQLQLNSRLVLVTEHLFNWFLGTPNLSFLKQALHKSLLKEAKLTQFTKFGAFRPTLYFSTSFKDQLKYLFGKLHTTGENNPTQFLGFQQQIDKREARLQKLTENGAPKEIIKAETELLKEESRILKEEWLRTHSYLKKRDQYLKSKTQLLLYNKDHEIKTNYHERYGAKDSYTATLIPEYGSWIRFNFQKNTHLNAYNFPLKNQEEELIIQLDKITQKPILMLLKEMGLTDLEIYQNLYHSDFFYFNKPLLVNSKYFQQPLSRFDSSLEYFKNISEFSQIFDPNYYNLGKIGRLRINNRLSLKISNRLQIITYEDIFAIIDKLISLTISNAVTDDIDHLKNKRVRSIGELLQNLFRIGFQRLVRKLRNQTNNLESNYLLNFSVVNATIREFFGSSQLSQYLDQTNPLSSLTHRRRISGLGPGGLNRDHISFSVRDIHPSHYGRICPIETPEGQNVGLIASLTTCARVNKLGFLETPFWRVINGKVLKTGNPIYLTAEVEDLYKIAPADIATNKNNYLIKNIISVRYKQDFINVTPSEVDFISISTIQVVSVAASLIPFFEHDDANRALMGSNMQRQSVPLIFPQKPIVGTGLENQIAIDCGMTLNAHISGVVNSVTANKIVIKDNNNKKVIYKLQKYLRSNQQTCINQRPIVWKGEKIQSGQILSDGPAITSSELSLGQNTLVAYMPWQGYNFEDAILISERLVYDDIFTSIHIERYKIEINRSSEISEQTMKLIPNLTGEEVKHLNDDGIVRVGTFVKAGDILVGKVVSTNTYEQLPESKLLRAIFGAKAKGVKDNSYRMPHGESGRVIETVTFNRKTKLTYKSEKIYVFIAQIRKIQVGDKIAGRHGNKGIISRILARQDMPFLPDGTPIDIILNPLGVPSRMNVGQLYECLLGFAGDKLNCRFKILPFDEMYGLEISRILINKKLRQASIKKNKSWIFNPYAPGKMVLIDGRTGKEFENPITVGNAYMLKLIHLVDDKMHSRATGPYSLITQQPLRGKAQHGGQRFGEMEVWALEGFGAAFTLKEILTIKSDDMQGRNETLNAIVKGQKIPQFGIPESFKVLVQELRSIGLDMSTYKINKFSSSDKYETEVNLVEKYNARSKTFLPTSNINDISF